ncbi:MAG: hypothetical protein KC910_22790, partial [Candidatus Eremiobacteraeota bacterium]|nr:hypothetical protein [Candidatus Eremiobacteraeota bacterium]
MSLLKQIKADGVDAALRAAAREGHRIEAVSFYNTLLEKYDLAEFSQSLQEDMRSRRAMFGDRPLCPFLRPNFVGREQLDLLASAVRGVVGAMNVLAPRIVEEPELQDFLGLTEAERRLAAAEPGYPELSVTSRLDSFLLGGKVRFVEYNAECPAGIGYNDQMMQSFLKQPLVQQFARDYPFQPMYTSESLLTALIDTYRRWGGQDDPVIAIVDYAGLPTRHEFEILKDFFEERGYKAVVADPTTLEYKNRQLTAQGQVINLVYRRLLINEFLERYEEAKAIFEAYADGTACVVNSFRSKYLHKKAIFALVTDPKYQDGMSPEQLFSVYTHVPWTRKVEDTRTTDAEGKDIELLYWIRKNRHELVMKPNDEYGGKGIFVGWELDDREWDNAIQTAVQSFYLVQNRVEVARDHYPTWDGSNIQWGEYSVDLDPFVFHGEIEGLLTRLSATALCNVTAGGGVVPTFV